MTITGTGATAVAVGYDDGGETHKERVDRELHELLEEVRVALPGAEVLFAFLLGIAFTERFSLLSLAVSGTIFLVGDVLYDTPVAGAVGAVILGWFVWFWFCLPLVRRSSPHRS